MAGLGRNARLRQEAYRELFRYQLAPGLVDQIRTATNGGFVLGTERFQKEIAATLGRRTWRGRPGRPIKSDGEAGQQGLELLKPFVFSRALAESGGRRQIMVVCPLILLILRTVFLLKQFGVDAAVLCCCRT